MSNKKQLNNGDIVIIDGGSNRAIVLTTNSPLSSNGASVLRIIVEGGVEDSGPYDIIDQTKNITAAGFVYRWLISGKRTSDEIKAADKFLRQWPEGPQVTDQE